MNLEAKLQPSDSVVAREVGGELVLMDLASGTYFGLEGIGGQLWQAIEEGRPLGAVLEQLEGEYDVSPERLREDASALINQLIEQRLVSEAPATAAQ
jgi:hypothetical protein